MATTSNSSPFDLKISVFFADVLKKIWEDGKRDWKIYSREQYRYFWDTGEVQK